MAAVVQAAERACNACGLPLWQHTRAEGEACGKGNLCAMAHDWRHVESVTTQTGETTNVRADLDLIVCRRCDLMSLTTAGGSA